MTNTITLELLRKRAEHNEGKLSDLEEITLHQYELEEIDPILGEKCRRLRILYLQNNLIQKIENLHHLKELEYLNMAVNSVKRIDGLEACESLRKLDLTVNYVQDLLSVENLKVNYNLTELFLMGNPCCNYPGYRLFVIATLPQLERLDGKEITKSERIQATQQFNDISKTIRNNQQNWINEANQKASNAPKYNEKGERLYGNDPKSRIEAAKELVAEQDEKGYNRDKSVDASKLGELSQVGKKKKVNRLTPQEEIEKFGKVMQCNEGKWDFKLYEENGNMKLEVPAGKFLSSANIDIDLQPTYIRITIKGKVLQLRFDREVNTEKSVAERSKVSGKLILTMPFAGRISRECFEVTNSISQEKPNSMTNSVPESQVKQNSHSKRDSNSLRDNDVGYAADWTRVVKNE